MQNKIIALGLVGLAAAQSAPSYEVTPAAPVYEPAVTTTGYACNPAHSYPGGAQCVSTSGTLVLVTPSASAPATTYACNPAHSYPNQQSCISTDGTLTLVGPSTTSVEVHPTSSAVYACNPAHQYPEGVQCISTNGVLTLVTPTATASVTVSVGEPVYFTETPTVSVHKPIYYTGSAANSTVAATGTAKYTPPTYTGAAVANVVSGAVAGVAGIFGVLFL